jgi:hypothetical protein
MFSFFFLSIINSVDGWFGFELDSPPEGATEIFVDDVLQPIHKE